jgi:hypothetical protein
MLSLLLPFILVLIPAFFLVTFLHEFAHVVAAKKVGYTITSFKPWPHYGGDPKTFFLGGMSYTRPLKIPEATLLKNEILISSAPLWTSMAFATIWFGISICTWLPLAAIGMAHVVDASWWWIHLAIGHEHADGTKWWRAWQKLKKM